MSLGAYCVALACLAVAGVPLAIAAVALRRTLLGGWTGAPARLAEAVVALALLTLVAEALGAVGLFERLPLTLACAVTAAAIAIGLRRREPRPAGARLVFPEEDRPLAAAAGIGVLAVVGQWGASVQASLERGMAQPDTLWYHLPFAARFAQDGWLTRLHFAEAEPITVFYPAGSELFHAIGMVLTERDVLSPFLNVGLLGLALLSGWCLGRPQGAGALGALGAGLALSVPIVWGSQAGQAGNDVAGVAFLLASAALLHCGGGRGPVVVVAGLAAGLAIAAKLSLVAPVLALTVAAVALRPRGAPLRQALAFGVPLVVAGGYWYARNLVRTGSPLPWVSFDLGPLAFEAPPRPLTRDLEFSLAHYAFDAGAWRRFFLPDLNWGLGEAWPALLALSLLGIVLAVGWGRGTVRALGLVALASWGAYLFTPNGASGPDGFPWGFGINLRYAAPPLALGIALLATAPQLAPLGRRRAAGGLLLATLAVNLFSDTGLWPYRQLEALLIAVAAGLAAALLIRARPRPAALATASAALAALVIAGGYAVQRDYLRERYARVSHNVPRVSVWGGRISEARIGVAGFIPQYPLYGRDLSNRVEQIGRRGPRGAFARFADCGDWRRAVNAGGYRYLVVAPVVSPNLPPLGAPKPQGPEAGWTRADRAAREVLRDANVSVFSVSGRLDPASCPREP